MLKVFKNACEIFARITKRKRDKIVSEVSAPNYDPTPAAIGSSFQTEIHNSSPKMMKMSSNFKQRLRYRALADLERKISDSKDSIEELDCVACINYKTIFCKAYGKLELMADGTKNFALFVPVDFRIPKMQIPAEQLPSGFFDEHEMFANLTFVAHFVYWPPRSRYARGKLVKQLGPLGDIEAETDAILTVHGVDTGAFSQVALDSLPVKNADDWCIDERELAYRRDFRKQTIFTIDPKTAKDLDDALHINKLEDCDGNGSPGWEVGVHIADVTHFLEKDSKLDDVAAARANTFYLVQKSVPMLPKILCEELCSLNPGVDRLAFSVVFKFNEKGNVLEKWFGRSVIKSCVKLAYEDAQGIIDNAKKEYSLDEFPKVFAGKKISEVKEAVIDLFNLSQIIRKNRMENDALFLFNPKLNITLDDKSGLPRGAALEMSGSANHLVEEFMLMANMAVAQEIYKAFPNIALLRCHPPPEKDFQKTIDLCNKFLYPVGEGTKKEISSSLMRCNTDPLLKYTIAPILSLLVLKCMKLAMYFCAGKADNKSFFSHYALGVNCYTHFTSPIRRYSDVVVHRLLAASLGYIPLPNYSIEQIQELATRCSYKKIAQRYVTEHSTAMFFSLLVKDVGSMKLLGIVYAVNEEDMSFDVLLVKYGLSNRIFTEKLKLIQKAHYEREEGNFILRWDASDRNSFNEGLAASADEHSTDEAEIKQTVRLLSVVEVVLSPDAVFNKYEATVVPTSDDKPLTIDDVVIHISDGREREKSFCVQ